MSTRIYFRSAASETVVSGTHQSKWQGEAACVGADARQGYELARTGDGTVEAITAEMQGQGSIYVQPKSHATIQQVARRLTRLQPTEAAAEARRTARASASAHQDSREAPADYLFPATATIARRNQLGRYVYSPVAAPQLPRHSYHSERGFVAVGAFGRAGDEAFRRGIWNKFVHSGRRSGYASDANIGHGAGVILGAWSCCRNVNPGAVGCVELPAKRAKYLAGLLQCRRCGLWYDPMDATSGKRAVCMYHPREPVSRRSHGAPFGDARFPCCGAVGFAHSKYASETGGKPSAWLGVPLTPAMWGCRQAPAHVPVAPLMEAGGPLDPMKGPSSRAKASNGSETWALAQVVTSSQLFAMAKRSPSSGNEAPAAGSNRSPLVKRGKKQPRGSNQVIIDPEARKQRPPNSNAARSTAVADKDALRRLCRVTLSARAMEESSSPEEARAAAWHGVLDVCGEGSVVAVWREPSAEYVPDVLGAAVDGLGGGLFGFGGDTAGGPAAGGLSGAGLVSSCLSDLLPSLGDRVSREDRTLLESAKEQDSMDAGEVGMASGGAVSEYPSEHTDTADSADLSLSQSHAGRTPLPSAAQSDSEAWRAQVRRRCKPSWDPSSEPSQRNRGQEASHGALSLETSGNAGTSSPAVNAIVSSPACWLVELSKGEHLDLLLDACEADAGRDGPIASVEVATRATDAAVFVRLVQRNRPKSDRSDEIDIKPTAVGGWLVASEVTTVDDLAAQLCDRLAWGGSRSKRGGAAFVGAGDMARIRQSSASFSLPGEIVERVAFAGVQPPRGAPVINKESSSLGPIGGRPEQNADDERGAAPVDPVAESGSSSTVRFHPGMWNAAARIRQVLKVGTAEVPQVTRGIKPFASPAMAALAAEPAIPADRPDAAVAAGVDGIGLLHEDDHIRGTAAHIAARMMGVPAKPAPVPTPEAPARPGSPRYVPSPRAPAPRLSKDPKVPVLRAARPAAPPGGPQRLVTPRVPALPSSKAQTPRRAAPKSSPRPEVAAEIVFPATFRPPGVVAGIGNGFGDWREFLPLPSELVNAAALAPDPSELGHEVIQVPKPLCEATAPTAQPRGVPMEWLAAKTMAISRQLPPPPLPIAPFMTSKSQSVVGKAAAAPRFAGPGSGGTDGSRMLDAGAARLELTVRDLATATLPRMQPKQAPPLLARSVIAAGPTVLREVLMVMQQHAGSGPRVAAVQSMATASTLSSGSHLSPRVAKPRNSLENKEITGKNYSIESKKIAQQLLPVAGNPAAQEAVANALLLLEQGDVPGTRRVLLGLAGAIHQLTRGRRDLQFGEAGLADAIQRGSKSRGGRTAGLQVPFGRSGRMELRGPLPRWVGAPHRAGLNDLPCVLWLSGARVAPMIMPLGARPAAEARKATSLMALPARLPVDDGHRLRRVYPALEFDVVNTASKPVKLSALQHLAEADQALDLHRRRAYGYRLYLPPRFGTSIDLPPRSITTITAITADPNFYSKCMMARVSLHWRDPSGDEMDALYSGPRKKWFPHDPPGLPKPGSSRAEPFRRVATLPPPPPEAYPWATSTAGRRTAQWARDSENALATGTPASLDPTSGVREAASAPGSSGDWGAPRFTNGRATGRTHEPVGLRVTAKDRSAAYRPRMSAAEREEAEEAARAQKKRETQRLAHHGDGVFAAAAAASRGASDRILAPTPFQAPWQSRSKRASSMRARSAGRLRAVDATSQSSRHRPGSPIRAVRQFGYGSTESEEDDHDMVAATQRPFSYTQSGSAARNALVGSDGISSGGSGEASSGSNRSRPRPQSARIRRGRDRHASHAQPAQSRGRQRPQSAAVARRQRHDLPPTDAAWAADAGDATFGGLVEEESGSLPEVVGAHELGSHQDGRFEEAMAIAILAGKGKDGAGGRPPSASTKTITTAGGGRHRGRTPAASPMVPPSTAAQRRRPYSARVRSRRLVDSHESNAAGRDAGNEFTARGGYPTSRGARSSGRRPRSSMSGPSHHSEHAGSGLPSVHEAGFEPEGGTAAPRAPSSGSRERRPDRPQSAVTRLGGHRDARSTSPPNASASRRGSPPGNRPTGSGSRPTSAARSRPWSAASSRTGAASTADGYRYVAGLSSGADGGAAQWQSPASPRGGGPGT